MKTNTKKLTFLSLATAAAMVLSFVETLLPPVYPVVPGIKIGLGNIVTTFLLFKFSWKEAAAVSIIRILLSALLFGNAMTLMYSFAGAFLSLLLMAVLKKADMFTVCGVSIAGGVMHNLGQIIIAVLLLKSLQIGYYMAVLLLTGTLAGALVGIISAAVLKYSKKLKIQF